MARFVACILVALVASAQATQTCWYPDNRTSEPGHVPCNQTISGASACCDPLDSCSASGFCLGRSGFVYRGSCTDQSWDSANCPNRFAQCQRNPIDGTLNSFWAAIWSCASPGESNGTYCCGYGPESCCNSSFVLGTTGVAFKPGLDSYIQSIKAAAIASVQGSNNTGTTLTAGSTSKKSSSDLGTKIGVGVGAPLGFLALGILGFLFWREWGKKRAYRGFGDGTQTNSMPQTAMAARTDCSNSQQRDSTGGLTPGGYHVAPDKESTHSQSQPFTSSSPKITPWSPAPSYENNAAHEAPANNGPQELASSPI